MLAFPPRTFRIWPDGKFGRAGASELYLKRKLSVLMVQWGRARKWPTAHETLKGNVLNVLGAVWLSSRPLGCPNSPLTDALPTSSPRTRLVYHCFNMALSSIEWGQYWMSFRPHLALRRRCVSKSYNRTHIGELELNPGGFL